MGVGASAQTKQRAKDFVAEGTAKCYPSVDVQALLSSRGVVPPFTLGEVDKEIEKAKSLGFPRLDDVPEAKRWITTYNARTPGKKLRLDEYCRIIGAYFARALSDAIATRNSAQLEVLASVQIPQIYAKLLDFALDRGDKKLALGVIKSQRLSDDKALCALCVIIRKGDSELMKAYFSNRNLSTNPADGKSEQKVLNGALAYAVERAGLELKILRTISPTSPRTPRGISSAPSLLRSSERKAAAEKKAQEGKLDDARQMVKILLEHGGNSKPQADPNAETSIPSTSETYRRYTLVTFARGVINDDLETTQYLLGSKRVTDIEKTSTAEEVPSPLWISVDNKDSQMAELLLSYKANPNRKGPKGTPFEHSRELKLSDINKVFGQWELANIKQTGKRPSRRAPKKPAPKKAAPKKPPPPPRFKRETVVES